MVPTNEQIAILSGKRGKQALYYEEWKVIWKMLGYPTKLPRRLKKKYFGTRRNPTKVLVVL